MFVQIDGKLHTGLDIFGTHKTANSKFTHERFNHILDIINVIGRFIIFTEHTVIDFIGIGDASRHIIHDVGYFFQIFNEMNIRGFHFLHSGINYLNMVTKLSRITCNLCNITSGSCYLFKCQMDQFQSFFNRRSHLIGGLFQMLKSLPDLSGRGFCFCT